MRDNVRVSTVDEPVAYAQTGAWTMPSIRLSARWLPWVLFGTLVGLSFTLNAWSLSVAGYGNTYYAAAVRSMTMSWSNFFFGAFDPGGFSTVDKPPVFLWVGAASARIFGYSTYSILLPSAVAGAASVGLLWVIVRNKFGTSAATIAGLVLALTPISVAVNRLNLPEPFMILALVGAAGAIIQSFDSKRWWAWTVLAGCLVGVAFNTKMLAAWIPGPALVLAIVVATRTFSWEAARQLFARLAVLGLATLIVSASWMVVVDLWPEDSRPYIGGSTDNTVLDLALGYNGFGRVDGTNQIGGGGRGGALPAGSPRFDGGTRGQPGQFPGGVIPDGQGQNLPVPDGGLPGGQGQAVPATGGGFAGPGGIFGGLPGPWRMFDASNGGQIGWLLPFALGGGLLALWHWRLDPARRAFMALFLGWIAIYGGVFSYAEGIFHSYYVSAMAPAVAAMVGVGSVAAVDALRRDRRWLIAIAGVVVVTLWAQLTIAGRVPSFYGWMRPYTVVVTLGGLALLAAIALWPRGAAQRWVTAGAGVMLGGLLLLPAAWSVSAASNASLNATLPQAGPQAGTSGGTFGSLAFDDGSADLAAWLQANHTERTTWDLVVSSSQGGSRLIAQYGLSVMSLGGFLGSDDTISVDGFAELVATGEVRYVLVSGGMGGRGGPGGRSPVAAPPSGNASTAAPAASGANAVLDAVQSACTAVSDPGLPANYQGSLYDCAGAADAIVAQTS